MRLDRWRIFDRRYSLGKLTKLWLVLRGWVGTLGKTIILMTQPSERLSRFRPT